jgi:hypothetical protein
MARVRVRVGTVERSLRLRASVTRELKQENPSGEWKSKQADKARTSHRRRESSCIAISCARMQSIRPDRYAAT